MDEIFTGSEWLRYLPIKESPAEKDTSGQSMTNHVLQPEKGIQLDVPLPAPEQDQSEDIKTPEQDQSEDMKTPEQDQSEDVKTPEQDMKTPEQDQSEDMKTPEQDQSEDMKTPEQDQSEDMKTPEQDQSEDIKTPEQDQSEDIKTPEQDQSEDIKENQDSVSDPQEDSVAKANNDLDVKQVDRDANVFAIPKALLSINAIQQRSYESNKSDDVYDCVDMYIIPKNDFPLMKRKASDAPLDFSAIKVGNTFVHFL